MSPLNTISPLSPSTLQPFNLGPPWYLLVASAYQGPLVTPASIVSSFLSTPLQYPPISIQLALFLCDSISPCCVTTPRQNLASLHHHLAGLTQRLSDQLSLPWSEQSGGSRDLLHSHKASLGDHCAQQFLAPTNQVPLLQFLSCDFTSTCFWLAPFPELSQPCYIGPTFSPLTLSWL